MRKALAISLIVTVLAVIAYYTKPTEEECIATAKEEFFEKKIAYTTETLPQGIERTVFGETLQKGFMQSLRVEDNFLYRNIYQNQNAAKTKIGWAAFGWINVEIK